MAFTERFEHKIEVTNNNIILHRLTTIVEKDDVEIARSHTRTSYEPGSDVSNADECVKKAAGAFWTSSVIAAFEAAKQAQISQTE